MGLKELRARWAEDPEFRSAFDADFPYDDAALAIVRLRADLRWTQAELARRIGSAQSVIARAESGAHNFSIDLLQRIASAADVTWSTRFDPAPRHAGRGADTFALASNVVAVPFAARSVDVSRNSEEVLIRELLSANG